MIKATDIANSDKYMSMLGDERMRKSKCISSRIVNGRG